jgi:hypothetical protein
VINPLPAAGAARGGCPQLTAADVSQRLIVVMTVLGSSHCLQEPQVWELLQRMRDVVKPYGVELLGEVHECFNLNIEVAK